MFFIACDFGTKVVDEYCGKCSGQGLLEKTKQVKVGTVDLRHQRLGVDNAMDGTRNRGIFCTRCCVRVVSF